MNPSSQQEMKENVEKVLQFVSSKRIRMHQASARDIVEGNLKSVMRLILALAAHFKPSVKSASQRAAAMAGHSQPPASANHRPHSATAMAQNAVAALAAARQDASRSGRDVFRYRQERQSRSASLEEEIENPGWSVRALVQQYEGQQETASEGPQCEASGAQLVGSLSPRGLAVVMEMAFFRRPVSEIIIRSRLDQSMEESQELKKELLRYKQESRNLQGVKDALQQRMAQQESSILQLRQELLRAGMGQDELHHQNVDLQRKVEERNRLLGDYKKELAQKDRLLQQQQSKLDEALRKLGEATHHKVDLQREVEHKDSLINELMTRQLDEADDLQLVRDALRSLRNSFSGHDPQHHTIDTLEQGIGSLMERLHMGEPHRRVTHHTAYH
ncbi:UNVERIFIED_CONTAM: hypothetical protein FKN15_022647 [Acipenser sinensis]